jgi:dolichol-phosphate mannosyltransferase
MTSEEKNHQVIDLTILLPTYNESLTIEKMLDSIVDVDVLDDYIEVLVIDDNSPDGTSEIVNSYIQKIKKQRDISFKIHTRKDKRGLSSAIIDGINLARGKFVIVMDSDLSHPPETIPDIYRELINNEFDIVIGSRYVKDGMIESWPLSRKLISKVGCSLAKLRLGLDVNDSMSGFFGLKKDLIQNLSFEAIGYKILLEILVKTKGAKVKEIPFVFTNRQEGKSKFKFSLINDYFRLLKILRKNHD